MYETDFSFPGEGIGVRYQSKYLWIEKGVEILHEITKFEKYKVKKIEITWPPKHMLLRVHARNFLLTDPNPKIFGIDSLKIEKIKSLTEPEPKPKTIVIRPIVDTQIRGICSLAIEEEEKVTKGIEFYLFK